MAQWRNSLRMLLLVTLIVAVAARAAPTPTTARSSSNNNDDSNGNNSGSRLSPEAEARLQLELDNLDAARAQMTAAERKLARPLQLVVTAPRLGELLPPKAVERATKRLTTLTQRAVAQHGAQRARRGNGEAQTETVTPLPEGVVMVDVLVREGQSASVVAALATRPELAGVEVDATLDALDMVRVRTPVAAVAALAALDDVVRVALPEPMVQYSAKVNVATSALSLDTIRAQYPNLTGAGVRICLLSDTIDGIGTSQAAGDAPPVIDIVVPPGAGTTPTGPDLYTSMPATTGEAVAMLEVMYAIAPGASYSFASARGGQGVMAQAVRSLVAANCSIIVDDVQYVAEPVFWDGPVAMAVDRAVAAGVTYITPAGNNYNLASGTPGAWEGASAFETVGGRRRLIFRRNANNVTTSENILTRDPTLVTLRWADSPTGQKANYDLLLITPSGQLLELGDDDTADPFEYVPSLEWDDTGNLIMVLARATEPLRTVFVCAHGGSFEIGTAGAIHGHAAVAGAISVGAVAQPESGSSFGQTASGQITMRPYSADGRRSIMISPYNVQLAADLNNISSAGVEKRMVPALVAPDGVQTSSIANFVGTSAAAAHVAGLTALVLQTVPGLKPDMVKSLFMGTAIDMLDAGWDAVSGSGVINLQAVITNLHRTLPTGGAVSCERTPGLTVGEPDVWMAVDPGCVVGQYLDPTTLSCVACPLPGSTSPAGSIGITSCQGAARGGNRGD